MPPHKTVRVLSPLGILIMRIATGTVAGGIRPKRAINGRTRPNSAGQNRTTTFSTINFASVPPSRSTSRLSAVVVMPGIPARPKIYIRTINAGPRVI